MEAPEETRFEEEPMEDEEVAAAMDECFLVLAVVALGRKSNLVDFPSDAFLAFFDLSGTAGFDVAETLLEEEAQIALDELSNERVLSILA